MAIFFMTLNRFKIFYDVLKFASRINLKKIIVFVLFSKKYTYSNKNSKNKKN